MSRKENQAFQLSEVMSAYFFYYSVGSAGGSLPDIYKSFTEPTSTSTTQRPTTAKTIVPLAILLNRIFGDDRWRALVKVSKSPAFSATTTAPPSSYQQDYKESTVSQGRGFQNNQISAENLFPFPKEKNIEDKMHVSMQASPSNVRNESVYNSLNAVHSTVPTSKHQDTYNNNGGYPSYQSLESINGNKLSSQSMNPKDQWQASNTDTQDKQTQYFGGDVRGPSSSDWFGSSVFDPNKVNSQAGLYNPNSAFKSFITQTGSSKDNAQLSTSYDADAVNQRYMQTGGFRFPPGLAQFGQNAKETQHPNAKYGSANTFDADALNAMLMNKWSAPPGGNTRPGGNSQSGTQYNNKFNPFQTHQRVNSPKEKSSHGAPKTNKEIEKQNEQKGSAVQSQSAAKVPNTQEASHRTQFSFIPGRLSAGSAEYSSKSQQYSRPSFLSLSKSAQSVPLFDPNAINAAQALYNPNAMSWLAPGHKRQLPFVLEEDSALSNNTVADNLTNATLVKNNTSMVNGQNNSMPSIVNTTPSPAYGGFDPNQLNAHQGQTNFIPGQITSNFFAGTGGNNFQGNGQGQSMGYANPPSQDLNFGAGLNFDIQSLLGFSKTNTNSSFGGTSGESMGFGTGGFDPNSVNANFADIFGNATNNGFGMTSNGGNAMAVGFGLFGLNTGKSNGSDPYQMYGYGMSFGNGGFDANAVNMPGYGAQATGGSNSSSGGQSGTSFGGFGGFPAMAGVGGYGAAIFDANQVNQKLIQSPYGGQSSNFSGNVMDYFLGISKGGQNVGSGSSYQSSFISVFDPSSVNQAVYDPNKYNKAHINFDPLEMLSKNPGMDKATLQSATFDPDKANSAYAQINFSPAGMIGNSLGINTSAANGVSFDPSKAGQASFVPSQMGASSNNHSSGSKPVFDPVEIMRQLMKDSSMFIPGTSGSQHINFDPSAIFQQGPGAGSSATSLTLNQVTTAPMSKHTTSGVSKTASTVTPTALYSTSYSRPLLTTMFATVSPMTNTSPP